MSILFQSTKKLENHVDAFLDAVSEGMIVFCEGVKDYLAQDLVRFEQHLADIARLEKDADRLRRDIETSLYSHSLIPEHRGDVLGLLETIDDVIDVAKETMNQFDVERPFIPEEFNAGFVELTEKATQAAEMMVKSARAFFREISAVKDSLHKVFFFEKEADAIADRLKRQVFESDDLELAQKMHLRYFALHIDTIADEAENAADRLTISAIKRTV